jgi:hypothetical protein
MRLGMSGVSLCTLLALSLIDLQPEAVDMASASML